MAKLSAKKVQDSTKSQTRKPAQQVVFRKESKVDDKAKLELLNDRFTPSVRKFFKETFGMDLTSRQYDVAFLHDLAEGRATRPVEMIVTPVAFDRDSKANVELDPVKVVASLVVRLPYDKETHKFAELSDKNGVFIKTIPCYDYRQKSDKSEGVTLPQSASGKQEVISFNNKEMLALEGIGIQSTRLYPGQFNSLPYETKQDIKAGKPFEVTGVMNIRNSFDSKSPVKVNVSGHAKLVNGELEFMPQYPVEKTVNSVLDIDRARVIGQYELDLFERNPLTKGILTDAKGTPVLNQAGKDLVKYGYSFSPVKAIVHSLSFDRESGKMKESFSYKMVMCAEKNGAIYSAEMKQEPVLGKDGKQETVTIGGEEKPKFRYVAPVQGINGEDKVRSFGKEYKVADAAEMDSYKRGRGAIFPDFKGTDPKTKKAVTYDAFAIPDILRAGQPRFFSEGVSKELIERRNNMSQKKSQNFSMGL